MLSGVSNKIVVAPIESGPNKAYVWPLIQPASEAVKMMDFLIIPNCSRQEYLEYRMYPPVECIIPFGAPVVPEVNSTNEG